jgi:hypothetical protein
MVTVIITGVVATLSTVAWSWRKWRRRGAAGRPALVWEIRVTSPDADGDLVSIDTEALYHAWSYGQRSTDGYLDILQMPRLHVWVKPRGWAEPDERLAQLDGTAALPPGLQ